MIMMKMKMMRPLNSKKKAKLIIKMVVSKMTDSICKMHKTQIQTLPLQLKGNSYSNTVDLDF